MQSSTNSASDMCSWSWLFFSSSQWQSIGHVHAGVQVHMLVGGQGQVGCSGDKHYWLKHLLDFLVYPQSNLNYSRLLEVPAQRASSYVYR